jgi:hypothetical protein
MRWLERYLVEGSPRLQHFAGIAGELANKEPTRTEPFYVPATRVPA